MSTRIPKIGDIVLYELTDGDAQSINRRRADAADSAAYHARIHSGAIVHTGNVAHGAKQEWRPPLEDESREREYVTLSRGDRYPLLITRVWGDTPESSVNGQVFLDGNDTIWVTSVAATKEPRGFVYRSASGDAL